MGKKEDLEKLDVGVRKKMLEILNGGDLRDLSDLGVVVNYLAKNNEVAEKHKSSVEEDIDEKLRKAKARRKAKANGHD